MIFFNKFLMNTIKVMVAIIAIVSVTAALILASVFFEGFMYGAFGISKTVSFAVYVTAVLSFFIGCTITITEEKKYAKIIRKYRNK